jgi:hypothetical protein
LSSHLEENRNTLFYVSTEIVAGFDTHLFVIIHSGHDRAIRLTTNSILTSVAMHLEFHISLRALCIQIFCNFKEWNLWSKHFLTMWPARWKGEEAAMNMYYSLALPIHTCRKAVAMTTNDVIRHPFLPRNHVTTMDRFLLFSSAYITLKNMNTKLSEFYQFLSTVERKWRSLGRNLLNCRSVLIQKLYFLRGGEYWDVDFLNIIVFLRTLQRIQSRRWKWDVLERRCYTCSRSIGKYCNHLTMNTLIKTCSCVENETVLTRLY